MGNSEAYGSGGDRRFFRISINVITTPEELMQEPIVQNICKVLNITKSNQLIIGIAVLLSLIYVLKNIIALVLADQQYKFSYYGRRNLKNRMHTLR